MPTLVALAKSLVRPPAVPATSRLANGLTVAVFLLFLAVPLAGSLLRPVELPKNEKRPPHPAPYWPDERWKAQTFPVLFDAYFGDRLGYRRELLDLRRRALVEGLGDSVSDTVWVGRDGWLYINCVGPTGRPAVQLDPQPQLRAWADALEERRQWLAARGKRYVVIVAPEKSSIYPEHLPGWATRHPPPDHLPALKPRIPNVALVDPRPAVVAAKAAASPLYYHTDSHWTHAGAFEAYRELGRQLERDLPGYRPKVLADFHQAANVAGDRDLALTLGRPPAACVEEATDFFDRRGGAVPQPADRIAAMMERHDDWQRNWPVKIDESARGVGRVVFLHDSFGQPFRDVLFTGDFRRLTSFGTYGFPTDVIEAEQPDVVVQMMVARTLTFTRPVRLATMAP